MFSALPDKPAGHYSHALRCLYFSISLPECPLHATPQGAQAHCSRDGLTGKGTAVFSCYLPLPRTSSCPRCTLSILVLELIFCPTLTSAERELRPIFWSSRVWLLSASCAHKSPHPGTSLSSGPCSFPPSLQLAPFPSYSGATHNPCAFGQPSLCSTPLASTEQGC